MFIDDRLVEWLRSVDRDGLTVAELADGIERKITERQWTTQCSLPRWRKGCDWVAGPSRDLDTLFALAAAHMAEKHPEIDMMKERIGVGARDTALDD